MPDLTVDSGTTSKIIEVDIFDSSSAVGALLAGLTYASSGLVCWYDIEGVAGAAIQLNLVTMTKGTWVSADATHAGFCPVDNTNLPGKYQLCVPNALLAGADGTTVDLVLRGATNMVPRPIKIQLTPIPKKALATAPVRKNVALAKYGFVMRDSATGLPVAGKTVTCTRSIDAGAQAAGTLANVAEVGNGEYCVDFGAGDTNGNVIVLRCTATGCKDTFCTLVPWT
jgi:hypothetical protein